MALIARMRNEPKPPWLTYVRPDVRAPLKSGLRFLEHGSNAAQRGGSVWSSNHINEPVPIRPLPPPIIRLLATAAQ